MQTQILMSLLIYFLIGNFTLKIETDKLQLTRRIMFDRNSQGSKLPGGHEYCTTVANRLRPKVINCHFLTGILLG